MDEVNGGHQATNLTLQQVLALWAKTPKGSDRPLVYHPLLCHLIDVASVTESMWTDVLTPWARRSIARALGLDEISAGIWISFWAGLHDIGKACPPFQHQSEQAWERAARAGFVAPQGTTWLAHGIVTAHALKEILPEPFGCDPHIARLVAASIGAHHGTIFRDDTVNGLSKDQLGRRQFREARLVLAQCLAAIVHPPVTTPPRRMDNVAAMWLAGLASVADWIGSNEEYFPYAGQTRDVPDIDPPAYAQGAREKAQRALRALGFLGWKPKQDSVAFHSLFGFQPNPLQRLVIDRFPNVTGPTLTIVEALMGQGKTEAAMWLVDRATHTLGQGGCYFALPTRATSNQMFDRVRAFLARRYPADIVNLQLLHGSASLSDQFDELKREHFRLYEATNVDGDEDRGSPAGVVASQWFTHSKQGLLAPFGVGTVDQALLAILQTKHVFVRLFGLSHKTVIIDEVHAYDTYMSTLLEQLLRWLGALDTSVILLSATLPEARRVRLLRAYEKGLGIEESRTLPPSRYPRVTWTSKSSGLQAESVPQGDSHRVWIRWIEGASTDSGTRIIGEALQQALAGGGNAAVICNTVDRAQKMYSALKDFFPGIATDAEPELDLLHARFPFEARDAREKRALRRYGKPPKPDAGGAPPNPRPHRSVLVATQVIEQSLDLDFDLLVTDMAPADLILQRVGRLHRHERGPRPTGSVPYVWIMAPEVAENGTPRYSQWTDTVYDEHILLRSWLALRDRETLSLPEDVEALVERVYGDQSCPPTLLPAIQHLWNVSEAEMKLALQKDADQAENRDVKPPWYDGPLWKIVEMPLAEDSPEVHRAHQALTRLMRLTVQVILLHGTREACRLTDSGHLLNLERKATPSESEDLLKHSLSLSNAGIVRELLKGDPPAGWAKSPLLRNHRPLYLEGEQAIVGKYQLRLDAELGLVITRKENG